MRSVFLAATLFAGIIGCGRGPVPTATEPARSTASPQTMEALVSTPSKLTLDKSQHGICPSQWTCDDVNWFSTQSACNASAACAPGPCFRDSHCMIGCICP